MMGAESKDPGDFYRSKDRLREFDRCSVSEPAPICAHLR